MRFISLLGSHPIKTATSSQQNTQVDLEKYTWENTHESKNTMSKEGRLALSVIKTHYVGAVLEFDDGSWIQRVEMASFEGERENSGTFPSLLNQNIKINPHG